MQSAFKKKSVSVAPCRAGKASPSVSIFARAPVCPDTCRYCRRKPCDVATVHDDHFTHAETLSHVFKPLVELPDRHLLASAVGLTLALITGRTDLCSAGVFGAGKTRAAAAVIVGLIAIDPTLSIMICTKENAAAQAVAEHIVSMQLPDALLAKFGRLIGFHEAQKGASARTPIDVGSQNRNQVLREKQVIIGCGGGFRHETAQKYSPILEWMAALFARRSTAIWQFGRSCGIGQAAGLLHLYLDW